MSSTKSSKSEELSLQITNPLLQTWENSRYIFLPRPTIDNWARAIIELYLVPNLKQYIILPFIGAIARRKDFSFNKLQLVCGAAGSSRYKPAGLQEHI